MLPDRHYRSGEYHREVFSADPFVAEAVARQRARKLSRVIAPEDTVFEYGVGTGLNLRFLTCRRRVGYDVSESAGEHCRQFGIEHVADLADLAGETFSVVLCHHVLEHTADPVGTLRELGRCLSPDGRLIVYVPFEFNRRYRRYWPDDPNRHLFSWNCLTLGNLVSAAGFTVTRAAVHGYGYEQRLARLARLGMGLYRLALAAARLLRPCDEVELIAAASAPPAGP